MSSKFVLYLAREDSTKRLKKRLCVQLEGAAPPARPNYTRAWPRGETGVVEIENWLKEHLDARVIVIDTPARFREMKGRERGYADDYADTERLEEFVDAWRTRIPRSVENCSVASSTGSKSEADVSPFQ